MNLTGFKQDYDWIHAFDEAFGLGFCFIYDRQTRPAIDGVTEVYAKDDGEHDLENWVCVFKYEDGRYGYLSAGCDYTGWDCQAGGTVEWFTSLDEATSHLTLPPETRKRLRPQLELLGLTRDWPDDKVFKLDDGWEND